MLRTSLQVVVSGSAIGEMAMHFIEKFGMMAIRIPSKFDLRRFCKATGSTALVKLQARRALPAKPHPRRSCRPAVLQS